jgi:hypothetical protein
MLTRRFCFTNFLASFLSIAARSPNSPNPCSALFHSSSKINISQFCSDAYKLSYAHTSCSPCSLFNLSSCLGHISLLAIFSCNHLPLQWHCSLEFGIAQLNLQVLCLVKDSLIQTSSVTMLLLKCLKLYRPLPQQLRHVQKWLVE